MQEIIGQILTIEPVNFPTGFFMLVSQFCLITKI